MKHGKLFITMGHMVNRKSSIDKMISCIMKKVFSILMLALTTLSCEENGIPCCVIVDIDLVVRIVDSAGESLLDEPQGIASNTIRLFYKVDNAWKEIKGYEPRIALGMKVEETPNGQKQLSIYVSTYYLDDSNITEIKLQFSESDFDIIKGEIDFSNGNTICTKVWCNDQIVYNYEPYLDQERIIELIK